MKLFLVLYHSRTLGQRETLHDSIRNVKKLISMQTISPLDCFCILKTLEVHINFEYTKKYAHDGDEYCCLIIVTKENRNNCLTNHNERSRGDNHRIFTLYSR